ncbi:hypothetical protein FPOAC2_12680 [Fusarium poae]|uniref:Uncharacterized protein n=1 Tax=Fusarium poae TaxID=36050 RepID=A0A1B8AGX4_FUSPO|nr:hypothetical protein FPOAC1_012347 [Fusarium poae]KAG8667515.1 hypothetical protein FPOAC1_012347 [Fusarium poae]OBS19739.1 hypothetical protein FPOA_11463 [Fusarium poae]
MSEIWKIVGDSRVTNVDFEPPNNWINNYDEMGGEDVWEQGGLIPTEASSRGLEGIVKPLFSIQQDSAEQVSLFELDNNYYIFNMDQNFLYQIKGPTDLQDIIRVINDASWEDLMSVPI